MNQASSFADVDFYEPPRGILTLDGEVAVSKPTKQDGDFPGELTLVVQGGGQRWKLSSEKPGELERWEEVRKYANAMNQTVSLSLSRTYVYVLYYSQTPPQLQ